MIYCSSASLSISLSSHLLCFGDLEGGFLHSSLKRNHSAGMGSKCDLSQEGTAAGGTVAGWRGETKRLYGGNCDTQPAGCSINVIRIL